MTSQEFESRLNAQIMEAGFAELRASNKEPIDASTGSFTLGWEWAASSWSTWP